MSHQGYKSAPPTAFHLHASVRPAAAASVWTFSDLVILQWRHLSELITCYQWCLTVLRLKQKDYSFVANKSIKAAEHLSLSQTYQQILICFQELVRCWKEGLFFFSVIQLFACVWKKYLPQKPRNVVVHYSSRAWAQLITCTAHLHPLGFNRLWWKLIHYLNP